MFHKTVKVGGLDIFYREAGPKDAPVVLLLHGFPTSSQMFRNLIPALADKYRVIAPDYPGYGHSSMPPRDKFAYTFDNLADVIDEFTEKLGLKQLRPVRPGLRRPVGYRLAVAHPERVTAIVVQNGNAYDEGLDNDFWKPFKAYWKEPRSKAKRDAMRRSLTYEATRWQYTHGVKDPELVSPDGAAHDQFLLDRPGNDEVQLDLFLSYGSNPPLYPKWQAYFRKHQPPVLIAWGKHDQIFPRRRGRAVQAGPEDAGVPPARRRPLRPGDQRRRDRRADARLPRQARWPRSEALRPDPDRSERLDHARHPGSNPRGVPR